MKENNSAYGAFHALVSGRVQGVGFRYYCRAQARRLGLSGWVQNLPDGDVEVRAEGNAQKLEELLQWLKSGPPSARVDSVQSGKLEFSGKFGDFQIR